MLSTWVLCFGCHTLHFASIPAVVWLLTVAFTGTNIVFWVFCFASLTTFRNMLEGIPRRMLSLVLHSLSVCMQVVCVRLACLHQASDSSHMGLSFYVPASLLLVELPSLLCLGIFGRNSRLKPHTGWIEATG